MVDEATSIMDERNVSSSNIDHKPGSRNAAVPLYQQVDLYGVNKRLN